MAKRRSTTRRELPHAAISAAQRETEERILRREHGALRSKYTAELAMVEQMLKDENHPLWRALALVVLPKSTVEPDEAFPDAIDRLIRELATSAPEALQVTRNFLMIEPIVDAVTGKKQARPGESEATILTRVLMEQGASSYEAVRAAGGHKPDVHSAALPGTEVRSARRLQATVRKEAIENHEKLVATVIPHRAVLVGPPAENVKDALLGLIDSAVRAAEKREAAIVRNIDGQRRKSGRTQRK